MPIPVEEAAALARAAAQTLEEETVPLRLALGRTLTRPVRAVLPQPPFDRSPLDGYALRAADIAGAGPDTPRVLEVTGRVCAGEVPAGPLAPGCAVRVMTGAMVPPGTECVVRQEDTDQGEKRVRIFRSHRAGENLCLRGEEYGPGTELLAAGTRLDPAALAVAAGAGAAEVTVRRRARTAILATGDEVCLPGRPLPPGKVYDANTAYLAARLETLGASVERTEWVPDDPTEIAMALDGCDGCDWILTTGGVSVGQKDFLEAALGAWGAEVVFHGVAMKPGMPTLLARRGRTVVLALSGNPFAAAAAFELLGRPILGRLSGEAGVEMARAQAVAQCDFVRPGTTRRYLRGFAADGAVTVPGAQANGQMRSMVGCNCLVELPGGTMHRGDTVDIRML